MFSPDLFESEGEKTLRILIVGRDRSLEEEFRVSLSGVPDVRGVLHFAPTYRQALEVVRDRQPNLVVIEIDRDVEEVVGLSKELHDLTPGAAVAAAFRPDRLEQSQSESAAIIELMRAHVRDFLRRPLSTTELRLVIDRLFSKSATAAPLPAGRVVSFVSNKGGAGKSTLAVNVACALAQRHPDDVLLVDLSLQLGTCALMLDLTPATTLIDVVRERDRLDETLLRQLTLRHPTGLHLLAAPGDAVEAADVDDEAVARILNIARRTFKYVVVDTFPVIDSIVMAVLDFSDSVCVVVQGTAPSVAGAARLLPVLDGLGFPPSRQRLVLNYNYKNFLGNLRAPDIADRLGRAIDYVVSYERRILVSMNTGSPHILHAGRWRRFRRTIDHIVADVDGVAGARSSAQRESRPSNPHSAARSESDRRRVADRRTNDAGRPQGERRSGVDRRAPRLEAVAAREMRL